MWVGYDFVAFFIMGSLVLMKWANGYIQQYVCTSDTQHSGEYYSVLEINASLTYLLIIFKTVAFVSNFDSFEINRSNSSNHPG